MRRALRNAGATLDGVSGASGCRGVRIVLTVCGASADDGRNRFVLATAGVCSCTALGGGGAIVALLSGGVVETFADEAIAAEARCCSACNCNALSFISFKSN